LGKPIHKPNKNCKVAQIPPEWKEKSGNNRGIKGSAGREK
jgi:hypothetical protein